MATGVELSKDLDTLWGVSPTLVKLVNEMSDGKFIIEPFAAGEIVPGLQVLDAVANGTVECGHSYGGYYIGKNPAAIFDGSLPFGLTPREHYAWYLYGDGKKLIDEVYDGMGVVAFPWEIPAAKLLAGSARKSNHRPTSTASRCALRVLVEKCCQSLGWSLSRSRAVKSTLRSRKARSTPSSGSALTMTRLGFHKVAKFMYLPGVLELEANNSFYVSKAKWAELPPSYQAMLRAACAYTVMDMLAGYDARNPKALVRLVAAGTQLSLLSPEILKALRTALEQVLDEEAAKSEQFKRVLENWRAFRAEQHRWFSIADARTEMSVYALTAAQ